MKRGRPLCDLFVRTKTNWRFIEFNRRQRELASVFIYDLRIVQIESRRIHFVMVKNFWSEEKFTWFSRFQLSLTLVNLMVLWKIISSLLRDRALARIGADGNT